MKDGPINRIITKHFEGKITIKEANDLIIEYFKEKKFDSKIMATLDKRRDKRTYAEFFKDISAGIRKEHLTLLKWVEHMQGWGFKVKWEQYGTDAIGEAFMEELDDRPDYLISVNDSSFFPVEVKTCPTPDINTFKVTDLHNYKKYSSSVLVCIGKIEMNNPVLKSFVFYGPKAVEKLYAFPGIIFHEFAPYKKAVRVSKTEMMTRKKASMSFEELITQRLIDVAQMGDEKPKFTGPLSHILNQVVSF